MEPMKTSEEIAAAPAARARGRPPKLSAAMIVAAATELLATRPPDEVSFALVAQRLGAPSSSVYNYFPNRDALFAAVAADVFASFRFDEPGEDAPWQQRLLAWLHEIDRFYERNPVAFRVMATSGQVSPAWVSVRAPLLRMLRELGFFERDLALVHAWFEEQVIGLLLIESHAGQNRPLAAGPARFAFDGDSEDQWRDLERRSHLPSIRREEILAIGFDAVIAALERLAASNGVSSPP